jgi:septin family protein
VDFANFENISGAKTAKEVWDILNNAYERGNKVKKVKLQSPRRKYELLGMIDRESIGEFFTRLQTKVNSIKNYGEQITNQQVIEKVLRTLNPQFDHIVVAI